MIYTLILKACGMQCVSSVPSLCLQSTFSGTTSTCDNATMNQVATAAAALASGVFPLVHVSTTLSCIVGSSGGNESLETELANATTYTVTHNLLEWYAPSKMAAYSALTGCLWYHEMENDSRQDALAELAEHTQLGKARHTHCITAVLWSA